MKEMRIAIIGCGMISHRHMTVIENLKALGYNLKVVAAAEVKNMYKLIGIDDEESEGDTGYFGLRPVGFGQMIWEPVLEAGLAADAKWVIVEQDEHYEVDPLECARRSREYLKILGW